MPDPDTADLLLVGGTIVTMDPTRRVIEDGAVLMRCREVAHVDIGEILDAAQVETELMLDRAGLLAEPATIWGRSRR